MWRGCHVYNLSKDRPLYAECDGEILRVDEYVNYRSSFKYIDVLSGRRKIGLERFK